MERSAVLIGVVAGIFYLIAATRLWRLSRRTGERPELLLALFFAFSGQWYLLFNAPDLLDLDPIPALAQQGVEWVYALGVVAYVAFLRCVFRPDVRWAQWLAWSSSGLIIAGATGSSIRGGFSNQLEDPAFLIEWVGYTIPCVWMMIEGGVAYPAAKKRARIGLGNLLSANRYLLWALFGLTQIASCVADLVWAYENGLAEESAGVAEEMLASFEIASVAVLWLVFFPPTFYKKWVARRAAAPPN